MHYRMYASIMGAGKKDRRERTGENLVWSRGMVWQRVSSFWAWVSETEEGAEL